MQLEWVKQQLLRRGGAAATRASKSRLPHSPAAHKSSAYIIAERMEPTGCSCVLVRSQATNTSGKEEVTPSLSSHHHPPAQHVSSTPAPKQPTRTAMRHRVTLPGITPGTVLRTRGLVVDWVRQSRQLPSSGQYTVVMQRGRRTAPSGRTSTALPAMPCAHAQDGSCTRCPWMALHTQQQGQQLRTSAAKARGWRSAVLAAVLNDGAAALAQVKKATAQGQQGVEKKSAPAAAAAAAAAAALTCDEVMARCTFLDPLAIAVPTNQLQALQLSFRHRPARARDEATVPFKVDASGGSLVSGAAPPPSPPPLLQRAVVDVVREGVDEGESLAAASMATGFHPHTGSTPSDHPSPTRGGSCLLETLEQKRLVPVLQRWAEELPTSMQARLRGVFISQPSSCRTRGDSADPHDQHRHHHRERLASSLQVVVVVENNTDVLGVSSPLCGPAQPSDMLSVEEQQLVAVVTAAAPLLTDIEVSVCVCRSGGAVAGRRDAGPVELSVQVLYPALERDASLRHYQQGGEVSVETTSADTRQRGRGARRRAAPSLVVRCWCAPLKQELRACLAPYHAALSVADPQVWLATPTDREARLRSGGESSRRAATAAAAAAVPWVPTFWRHPAALDHCCSVLLSMMLEGAGASLPEAAEAQQEEEQQGGTSLPLRVTPSQQCCARLDVRAMNMCGTLPPPFHAAALGASVGQLLLDAALNALIENVQHLFTAPPSSPSSPASSSLSEGSNDSCASPAGSSTMPRCIFVSVNEWGATTDVSGILKDVAALSDKDRVRLCLYACTSTMQTEKLASFVSAVLRHALTLRRGVEVRTGVVDTDPLASSYVAYAVIDVSSQW